MLFGIDTMGCALESDLFGDFTQCVTNAFASVNLEQNLTAIYRELLSKPRRRILVMQYHLSIPSVALAYSAVQIEQMGDLLNGMIARSRRRSRARAFVSSRRRASTWAST